MEVHEQRPGYVDFERRAVEDREASLAADRFITKDADFVIFTPPGSKDRIEFLVDEWFERLKNQVRQERYPADWYTAYQHKYKVWTETQQTPVDGTPVGQWPALSPAQVKNCMSWGMLTVESIAEANEEALRRLGMGARDLKERAAAWLKKQSSVTTGLEAQIALMNAEMEKMRALLSAKAAVPPPAADTPKAD